MRDVADTAGVSLKTVSRVVNDEPGVGADLVASVEHAIAALGYQRDDRARQLRTGGASSRTIGFAQVDIANPFFAAVLRGIEDTATAHGFQVIAGSSDGDPVMQADVLRAFIARRVDGIIIVPSTGPLDLLEAEIARGTAVVFLDLEPPEGIQGDVVRSDHRGGSRMITRHLIERGHERIAFLGDSPQIVSAQERYLGFADELRNAGLTVSDHWVHRDLSDQAMSRALVERLLDGSTGTSTPTGLVCARNFITIGAVRALHGRGLQHDIALVGFDDLELADVVEPGITVMPQGPRELGRRAAKRLFERLAGDDSPPLLEVPIDRIIVRGSGEIPPTGSG